MSKQDVYKFIDKLENDTKFKKQFFACKSNEEKKKLVSTTTNFKFTQKELREVLQEHPLNDEDIKKIAAGLDPVHIITEAAVTVAGELVKEGLMQVLGHF